MGIQNPFNLRSGGLINVLAAKRCVDWKTKGAGKKTGKNVCLVQHFLE